MINKFRQLIQEKLNLIEDLDSGEVVGDDLIEEGKYYFGYKLKVTGNRYNLDYSNLSQTILLTGYLSTKGGSLSKLDDFTDEIIDKLSQLRIICSTDDVSVLDTKVRKVLITGATKYDYLDRFIKIV